MNRSSSASSTCRIDWQPSAWLSTSLLVLGVAAAVSLAMSELPAMLAGAAGLVVAGQGWRLARRDRRREPVVLAIDARGAWLHEAGREPRRLANLRVERRGPLTTLAAESGAGRVRLAWWPDTLSPEARRRLVLCAAALSRRPDKPLPAMAA